jgi:hypothetical protein
MRFYHLTREERSISDSQRFAYLICLSTRGKECAMTGHIDEFDGASLLTPIPAGDEGAVVDVVYRDRGWVTVEFVRNGKMVAVTDVPLTRLRLLRKAPTAASTPEPEQRITD